MSKQKPSDQGAHLRQLLEKLPPTKSGDAAVLARLIDLRRRFHGWLHQDEFGPSRGEQTAALRRLSKSAEKLSALLTIGKSRYRARLNAALRREGDAFSSIPEALVAAAEGEIALSTAGTSEAERGWFFRLRIFAKKLKLQLALLDDATDSQITDTALLWNLELSPPIDRVTLAKAERWLRGYRDVLSKTLETLKIRRGAQERVSLKLLVEELCAFWEHEMGLQAKAHGIARDVYTSRSETDAGRFVTAAVEAMLPDQVWYEAHAAFARSVRAETFLPDEPGKYRRQNARATQVLVIMRGFVRQRSEPDATRRRAK